MIFVMYLDLSRGVHGSLDEPSAEGVFIRLHDRVLVRADGKIADHRANNKRFQSIEKIKLGFGKNLFQRGLACESEMLKKGKGRK